MTFSKRCFLDDMEARTGCRCNVAVRLLLDELHCLLLLQNQEAVEFGCRLLLVVVPAEVQEADRLGTRLGHHPLWDGSKVALGWWKSTFLCQSVPQLCDFRFKYQTQQTWRP